MPQLQLPRSLALVVGCTNGKTGHVPEALHVRSLPAGDSRYEVWESRVNSASECLPLRDLYKGQQWKATLALENSARDLRASVDLWVVSAGLGLRRASRPSPGYSASFTSGPDCPAATLAGQRRWWQQLQSLGDVGDLSELLRAYDDVLLVLSPQYWRVIEAEAHASTRRNWVLVSSGAGSRTNVISTTGLQDALRSSDLALNLKGAARFLEMNADLPLAADEAKTRWEKWTLARRQTRKAAGSRLDDDAIRQLIRTWQASSPGSASVLLRRLRDSGFACEQGRFALLYHEELRGVA